MSYLCLSDWLTYWLVSDLAVIDLSTGVSPPARLSVELQVGGAWLTSKVTASGKRRWEMSRRLHFIIWWFTSGEELKTKKCEENSKRFISLISNVGNNPSAKEILFCVLKLFLPDLIKSSVVDSLLNPRAIKISSVVLWRLIPMPGWP